MSNSYIVDHNFKTHHSRFHLFYFCSFYCFFYHHLFRVKPLEIFSDLDSDGKFGVTFSRYEVKTPDYCSEFIKSHDSTT